jgi:hypothetical protein
MVTGRPIAAAVVARMNGGYAQSRLPLVTMMDMLLVSGTATGAFPGASSILLETVWASLDIAAHLFEGVTDTAFHIRISELSLLVE